MEKAIIVKNLTKKYKLYNGTKERLLDLITPKSYGEDFYALAGVSFEAKKGDSIGFIGINGSGKSTLSNIIAGIVPETSGIVKVNGETSLIAVAAGLKADLTGRDNIELKCLMLGFNKQEIKALEPAIIDFSELGKFIDQPVKSYSSGMKSRLGFAISVNVDPEILIIDEALSVGDKAFAEKSLAKMKEFKQQEKTMIFVSHSIGQMKEFCDKILWLEFGTVKDFGTVEEVIPKYELFLKKWKKMNKKEREAYRNEGLENRQKKDSNNPVDGESQTKGEIHLPSTNENYVETPISRLGHIKVDKSYIYSRPNDLTEKRSSESYRNYVYYIKRKATYNNELFYLISHQPSAKSGVIGWIKAVKVSSRINVAIERDSKTFYLKGTGIGHDRPWGGKKNHVYPDLNSFKDAKFKVEKTERVGKGLWYRGILNGKKVWIHNSHLETRES